eukprot:6994958-Pyramimonas_sp.AAC.1
MPPYEQAVEQYNAGLAQVQKGSDEEAILKCRRGGVLPCSPGLRQGGHPQTPLGAILTNQIAMYYGYTVRARRGHCRTGHQDLIKPSCHSRIQFSRQFFTDAICPCRALEPTVARNDCGRSLRALLTLIAPLLYLIEAEKGRVVDPLWVRPGVEGYTALDEHQI